MCVFVCVYIFIFICILYLYYCIIFIGYVTELMHMSMRRRLELASYSESLAEVAPLHASTPDFLTAGIEKEDKEEVVKHHKTRFLKAACDVSVPLISTEENSCREKQRKRCQKRRNEDNEQRQEQKKRKMK